MEWQKYSLLSTLPGVLAVTGTLPISSQAHLIELPVELGRLVGFSLGGILAEQEDQAAVVHVQGVVVPVHICTAVQLTALFPALDPHQQNAPALQSHT